jgi:hypothetical protein
MKAVSAGYTVEFVYEDGKRVSVNLRDEDAEDFIEEQDVILRAKALLDHADASGVRGDMPSYDAHSSENPDPSTKNNPRRERRRRLSKRSRATWMSG